MRSQLLAAILILLLAYALRLYHLDSQSIWFDEGWSAYAAEQPTLIDAWNADQTNPPLYYMLVNIAARGFGTSEFSLRYVSLLLGILTIALAYRLGKTVTAEKPSGSGAERTSSQTGEGISAVLMLALTPLMWWAAQEARMYTLLAVLVMIAALAWERLRTSYSQWAWLALWLAELALLYAHNTGPIIVLWLNAVTLLCWITSRSLQRPHWKWWVGGQVMVGLLYLPYFVGRFLLLPGANDAIRSTPPFSVDLLHELWQSLWTGPWSMVNQKSVIVYLSWAMLIVVLISIAWRQAGARWLVVHTALLSGGLLLGLSVLGTDMHSRYLVMIAPLLLSAVSFGLPATSYRLPVTDGKNPIPTAASSPSQPSAMRYPLSAISRTALVVLTCLMAIHFATTNPRYQHDDARGMVQHYAETLGADDTVLAWSYAERYELRYYWGRLGVQAKLVTLPEGADMETILPLLPTSSAVARNIWFTQRADYRGMLGCLLGDGQVRLPDSFRTFGMVSEAYRQATIPQIDMQPVEATVGDVARIVAVGRTRPVVASQSQCIPVEIELVRPVTTDLQAQIYLATTLDGQRVPLISTDVMFADRRQRTSSSLQAGDRLRAFALVVPPYGLAAGDYRLYLRIYDNGEQASGYPLQMDTQPAVIDLPIREWTAQEGANWSATGRDTSLPHQLTTSPLLATDAPQDPSLVRNGDFVIVRLLWETASSRPLPLELSGDCWSQTIPVPDYTAFADVLLDVRRFQIPLEAGTSEAVLRLRDGQVVGRYQVENVPAIYDEPIVEHPLGTAIPNVGTLIGYSLPTEEADLNQPFAVNLVWQAAEISEISYTVFIQFIDTDGNVIAQSDMIPAGGTRPTTGWRSGEYIVDEHLLQWNDRARTGSARLIVGLYDANTGERVRLMEGSDFIQLRANIPVR